MKRQRILLCLFILFYCGSLKAQTEHYAKVKVQINHGTDLDLLYSYELDIDHFEKESEDAISFYINTNEYGLLEATGLPYEILIPDYAAYYQAKALEDKGNVLSTAKSNRTANNFGYGAMGGFYTLAEIESKLDEMYNLYPNLITAKYSIGTSIEGRNIWAVKISDNPNVDENEAVVYYDALHHAREPLSMAVTINYMFWLLENYNQDPLVTHIVNNRELYFVPCVNPDGYEYNRQTNPNGGGLWRKNRRNNGDGCYGVDLNRNYNFGYAYNNSCSSPSTCSNVYRGTNFFSEPETTATSNFMLSIQPSTAFSTHSTAGSYLMPYGYNDSPPAFDIYSEWASDFLSDNDYPYGTTSEMLGYTSCGGTRDFMHNEGIYGWTPEIDGSGFWPAQSEIFSLVDENVYPLFYQSWIAGGYTDVQSHSLTGSAEVGASFQLQVEVKNKGVGGSSSNVVVAVSTPDPNITVSGNGSVGTVAARTKATTGNFSINVGNGYGGGDIPLTITVSQSGVQTDTETIVVPFGTANTLFSDDANSTTNWSSSGNGIAWGLNYDDSYNGNTSFGDSDGGNSINNTLNYFTQNNALNLSATTRPMLEFASKWSLDAGDFVALQISTNNGSSWSNLKTFTAAEPWHQELIDLSAYKASAVKIRFLLDNDGSIPGDGFYFDQISITDYACNNCPTCPTSVSQFPQYDSFESGIGNWIQSGGDDLNWTRDSNGTPSVNTGPSNAANGSFYMYIEASNPNFPGKTAGLESACLDLSAASAASLTFSYHMYGTATTMNLQVQASTDDGSSWSNTLWSLDGNQGNQWNNATVNLDTYAGQFVTLRFFGTTGTTWQGDIAIDNVNVSVSQGCTTVGQTCNDNNACTTGDVYDANCNCTGTLVDTDGDGVCDANDQCPGSNDGVIGSACDDGNVCTTGDVYDNNCNCSGVYQDSDGDGICDANDPTNGNCTLGASCNDGNACTSNDAYDANCNCVGTLQDSDGDGVCDTNDQCPGLDDNLIGTACSNGDPCIVGETYNNNCACSGGTLLDINNNGICDLNESNCTGSLPESESFESGFGNWNQASNDDLNWIRDSGGTPSSSTGPSNGAQGSWYAYIEASYPNYPNKTASLESTCLDVTGAAGATLNFSYHMYGSAATMNLVVNVSTDEGANWSGNLWSATGNAGNQWNNAVVDLSAYTGSGMVIRFLGTTGTTWQGDIAIDNINVAVSTPCTTTGQACNDNNPCTINDMIDSACNCVGTFVDSDGDGVCDANDQCLGINDNIIGSSCSNGDPCIVGETYDANCSCSGGSLLDNNNNGICDLDEGGGPCTETTIDFNNFDSNWGIWNDGGSDCARVSSNTFANSGSICVRLRDNSNGSVMTTDILDLSSYDYVRIDFSYIANSFDSSNEDFWFQVSTDGGASYTIVEEWNRDDEFVNNVRESGTATINAPLGTNMRLRLRCDATANGDQVYIDDVQITGCTTTAEEAAALVSDSQVRAKSDDTPELMLSESSMKLAPNPTRDIVNVLFNGPEDIQGLLIIYDLSGKEVKREVVLSNSMNTIQLDELENGLYVVSMRTAGAQFSERLLIQR